jgi:hypothetical protein
MNVQIDMVNIDDELAKEKVAKNHDTKLNDDVVDGDHHSRKYDSLENEDESVAL